MSKNEVDTIDGLLCKAKLKKSTPAPQIPRVSIANPPRHMKFCHCHQTSRQRAKSPSTERLADVFVLTNRPARSGMGEKKLLN